MVDDRAGTAVVKSVISLAHDLEIRSIAEGVENRRTLALLKSIGCREARGYHIARPMSADMVEIWLSDRVAASHRGGKGVLSATADETD